MGSIERVAILSVHTCPLAMLGGKKTGGMNVYVRELSRELSRRGIAVDVYTRSENPGVPHINDADLGPHARVIHVPTGPEEPMQRGAIAEYLPQFVAGVKAFAQDQALRYDVIHSHYWLSGSVAEALRDEWDVPILHMFHTLGHMKNRVAQDVDQKEAPARVEAEQRLVSSVDCIVAATPAERAQLMWLYDADMRKIKVVPPGVDTTRFHPLPAGEARREIGVPEDQDMVLFVGRIEPLKGIDTLIRAVALVRQEHPNMCVTVIGGDDEASESHEMNRLKELREELGVDDLVTFMGARDQDRLQYYYSAAQVVVMPSDYESFGMVALEAMACGTPVIASEVGGLAYLVQDAVTGFHVPYRDPEELAGKISLLIDNPALRAEMSAAAVAHAQTYDWKHITDEVLATYEGLVFPNGR
jgi:D-inositol-3-phosphate glycosyltransferase